MVKHYCTIFDTNNKTKQNFNKIPLFRGNKKMFMQVVKVTYSLPVNNSKNIINIIEYVNN